MMVAQDEGRFQYGPKGAHLLTTFQCPVCHFRNIQGRDPAEASVKDTVLMGAIKRASLDAIWARAPGTVASVVGELNRLVIKADSLGIDRDRLCPEMGPLPVSDECGMAVAVAMLERSLDPGKYSDRLQFDSVRKGRAAFSNVWHASVHGKDTSVAVRGRVKVITSSCPTNGDWFEKFMMGMHARMGDEWRPDFAVSSRLMVRLLDLLEEAWCMAITSRDERTKRDVTFAGAFAVVSFGGALRGEEAVLMDLRGSAAHVEDGTRHPSRPHAPVALLGKFKGEVAECHHFLALAEVTRSGIDIKRWVRRAIEWYTRKGVVHGPVFRSEKAMLNLGAERSERASLSQFADVILPVFERIRMESSDLIPDTVDVYGSYGMSRSFRRGADTEAIARGYSQPLIDLNCRWRTIESAKGKRPRMRMSMHYAQAVLLLDKLIEFSAGL